MLILASSSLPLSLLTEKIGQNLNNLHVKISLLQFPILNQRLQSPSHGESTAVNSTSVLQRYTGCTKWEKWRESILRYSDRSRNQPLRRRLISCCSGGTEKGYAVWRSTLRTRVASTTNRPVHRPEWTGGPLGRLLIIIILQPKMRSQISRILLALLCETLTAVVTAIWTSVNARLLRLVEFWGNPYYEFSLIVCLYKTYKNWYLVIYLFTIKSLLFGNSLSRR